MDGFRAPQTLTPDELGDTLARLVWESFSDFVANGDAEASLEELGVETEDGLPPSQVAEEALIFLMWAHTRGTQRAFVGRAEEPLIRGGLDSLHKAIFDDMIEQGTPEAQLPLFEARVGARYSEYNSAAADSDSELSRVALRYLTGGVVETTDQKATAVLDRALAVARPLEDFLEEVKLVEA
ncbi:MAG: hypothetical protein P8188_01230 [Gemmatimonadota bacterium]|jgi:hypothetical protein